MLGLIMYCIAYKDQIVLRDIKMKIIKKSVFYLWLRRRLKRARGKKSVFMVIFRWGIVLSFSLFSTFLSARLLDRTLAVVEGEMISLLDVKDAQLKWKRGFMKHSMLEPLFIQTGLKSKSTALKYLIYKTLLDVTANKMDLSIPPNQLKQELEQRRKKRRLSKKAFSRLLVKNGFTSLSYKKFLKKSILRKILIQKEVLEHIRISDNDLNEYAMRIRGRPLFSEFQYDLEVLFFPPSAKGKKSAHQVFKKLLQDLSYFKHWKPSFKGSSRRNLNQQNLSGLQKKVRKVIKNLSVGQHSQVLWIPNVGYHIFKVLWKTPVIQNKKLQKTLSQKYFKELFQQKLKHWLEKKKSQSFVRVHL